MKKWEKILISLMTVFVLTMLPAESAIPSGTVCVTEAAPRISSSRLTMIKGQSKTLKITGLKKGQKITWKSSSPKLVTVSASGKLSAKAAGNATVTAQVNGIRFVCKVNIQKKSLSGKASSHRRSGKTTPYYCSEARHKIKKSHSEQREKGQ